MKVANIKSGKQFETINWVGYGIETYGETNDFPQSVHEILKASKTGTACLDIYNDFTIGHGFKDEGISNLIVNSKRERLKKVFRKVAKDLDEYNGVAIHINYNLNYKISSIAHVPFETCRLGLTSGKSRPTKIKVHPDWGRRQTETKFRWLAEDIDTFDVFNPDPSAIESQVEAVGGWNKWNGQIFYFSGENEGDVSYPMPKYIAEMTDMRTEEGLSNVTGRNVCSNFMLAGMLIDIIEGADQNEKQVQEKYMELVKFQGDENALQLWYGTAKSKDEVPVFVPFQGNNYDKAFTVTQQYVPDAIGQAFKQPPILRAKDVAGNLGAELLTNAYKFYNTVTVRERQMLTEIFEEIFTYWWAPLNDPCFEILPLVYNAGSSILERVGKDAMKQILDLIADTAYTLVQKRNLLKHGFGLEEWEALALCPNEDNNNSQTIDTDDTDTSGLEESQANSGEPTRRTPFGNVLKRIREFTSR